MRSALCEHVGIVLSVEAAFLAGIDHEYISAERTGDRAAKLSVFRDRHSTDKSGINTARTHGSKTEGSLACNAFSKGVSYLLNGVQTRNFCSNLFLALLGKLLGIELAPDSFGYFIERLEALFMDIIYFCNKEILVVYGNDVGNLSGLGIKSPASKFLGLIDGTIGRSSLGDALFV